MGKSLLLALGLVTTAFAQGNVDRHGLDRTWLDLGQPAGAALRLDLDAGALTVIPSEDGHLRLRYVGKVDQDLSGVRLRFEPAAAPARFRLQNTPHNSFEIELQVPRRLDLDLQMSAGEVKIRGIEGSKQVRLGAGEITLEVGDGKAYGPVSASVWAGEVKAGPFGEGKEGLFRTFSHQGSGPYRLQAKVKAGEIRFVP